MDAVSLSLSLVPASTSSADTPDGSREGDGAGVVHGPYCTSSSAKYVHVSHQQLSASVHLVDAAAVETAERLYSESEADSSARPSIAWLQKKKRADYGDNATDILSADADEMQQWQEQQQQSRPYDTSLDAREYPSADAKAALSSVPLSISWLQKKKPSVVFRSGGDEEEASSASSSGSSSSASEGEETSSAEDASVSGVLHTPQSRHSRAPALARDSRSSTSTAPLVAQNKNAGTTKGNAGAGQWRKWRTDTVISAEGRRKAAGKRPRRRGPAAALGSGTVLGEVARFVVGFVLGMFVMWAFTSPHQEEIATAGTVIAVIGGGSISHPQDSTTMETKFSGVDAANVSSLVSRQEDTSADALPP